MNLIARLKALVNRLLPRASFARSVGVLAGGTAAAQAIGVLVLPVITRLYTPADLSLLAVYSSILGFVAVVACLRLDIAIPLPERDEDAANLLALALLCCTAFAALAALAVWWFPRHIVKAISQPGLQPFLWMIPLGIWLASAYSAVQFWAIRKKRFTEITKTRLSQTLGSVAAQLGFGLWGVVGPFGLLLGQLINSGAGIFGLGRIAWRYEGHSFRQVSVANMLSVLRAHDRFPKYSTFEALANNAGIQLPILFIAAVAMGSEAGYIFLAMRVMGVPMTLIGGAVSQVYLSRAPGELREQSLGLFTENIFSNLVRLGVGPLIFIGIVAPAIFPFIFGAKWQRAGELVTWMTPWFIFQFLSSPISMVMHITGNQRKMLLLTFFGGMLRLAAVIMAWSVFQGYVSEFYSVASAIVYLFYGWIFLRASGVGARKIASCILRNFYLFIAWVFFGGVFRMVMVSISV